MIEELIKREIPFAIVKSYIYVLNIPRKEKVYEILLYDKKTKTVTSRDLTDIERKQFVKMVSKFVIKHNTEDGVVYEFLNFKEHFKIKQSKKPKKTSNPKITFNTFDGISDELEYQRKKEKELAYQRKINKKYLEDYER